MGKLVGWYRPSVGVPETLDGSPSGVLVNYFQFSSVVSSEARILYVILCVDRTSIDTVGSILWEGHRSPWCDRGRYYNCQLYWEPQERSDSTHREAVGLGAHAAWRTPLLAALAATRSPGRPSAAA